MTATHTTALSGVRKIERVRLANEEINRMVISIANELGGEIE